MHSSIIGQIMTTVWNWFTNFSYNWDTGSFTILDYFKCMCAVYLVALFIHNIVLFTSNFIENNFGLMGE